LLIFRDAKNARNAEIAPNWNVSGTRGFSVLATFIEGWDSISGLASGKVSRVLTHLLVPALQTMVSIMVSAWHGLPLNPGEIRMLKYGQQYVDKGAEYYEQRNRQQQIEFLRKKAARLGLQLAPAILN
jgi:hypothetical protein